MFSPFLHSRRWTAAIIFGGLLTLVSSLGAQNTERQREAANRQLYLMMYNTAMADSVISTDERMQLETLQQALGLNIDIMEDMYAVAALPGLTLQLRW